jgi:hypothetical protein
MKSRGSTAPRSSAGAHRRPISFGFGSMGRHRPPPPPDNDSDDDDDDSAHREGSDRAFKRPRLDSS